MLTTPTTINSGSSAFFSVDLEAPGGGPATPLQAFITVYDLTSGEESVITAESPISVAGPTLTFKTTPLENTIIDTEQTSEKRRVLLRAVFGVDDEFTDVGDYTVKRIVPNIG